MKVLITTDLYAVTTNGVVTSLCNLRDSLEARGHEVQILTFSKTKHSYKEGNVTYIRSMPFPVYKDVRTPLTYHHKLIKDLIAWKPDVIHSQCEFFSYSMAKQVSKKTGAPIVNTCHTMYEQYSTYVLPGKKFGKFMVRNFMRIRLKGAAALIAPTSKVKDTLLGYNIKNRIVVLPTGINLEQHKQRIDPAVRAEKRAEIGYTDENIVLVNLGRLGYEKKTDELIDFMVPAVKAHPNVRLLIVGDGPARADLEAQAAKLGVSEYVHFAGMVKPTEVHEYYQLGDIFVSASTSEAQGLTYVEGSANGLPLLCREDPCVLDVISVGESGYAYKDEADFLEKLDFIVSNPEWREKAVAASEAAASRYDKANFGLAAETLYLEVIAAKNGKATETEEAAEEATEE